MIAYIFKVILFSAILFLIYALFMEKEKMHRFKRFYLLVSLILPFIVPLITIPGLSFVPKLPIAINLSVNSTESSDISDNQNNSYNITGTDRTINDIQNTIPQLASAPGNKGIWFILLVISCILVTLVMIIRFIRNIISIYLTIITNKSVAYHEGILVLTNNNRIPHSFLNYIFVNREDYERGSIEKEILRHELTHVSQKHSLDVLFVELILIFAWINPILFFYRKAIRLNHEFLADKSVVETYFDIQTYQYLLFDKTRHTNGLSLSCPFNYLLTKKRIMMMSRKASPGIAILKQIAIIPLILIVGFLFTSKSAAYDIEGKALQHQADSSQNFGKSEEQNPERLEFERLITP
jgi:bla regulator protein blaR1